MVSSVPVLFVVAIVDNYYAWDVSHDPTISTALSRVSVTSHGKTYTNVLTLNGQN